MTPLPSADDIVREFFLEKDGEVVLLSEDDFFAKTLRSVVLKTLGVSGPVVRQLYSFESALKMLMEKNRNQELALALVERKVAFRSSAEFIIALRGSSPSVRIMLLTDEADVNMSAFMHEAGVDSILTKPASTNDIVEKLAYLVRPPEKIRKLMEEGRRMLAKGRTDRVLELSDKILELKPGSPAALMLRGEALLARDEHELAVESFTKAHESSPMYLEPLKLLVEAYRGVDEDKQLHYLKKLDKISPLNIRRKYDIGRLLIRGGDPEKAEKYFDAALERAVQESMSIIENVALDIVDSLPEQSAEMAEKYLNRLLQFKSNDLSSEDIGLFNRRGMTLRRQGKWKEAIDNYQAALDLAPEDEGLHYNMGLAWVDGREFRKAAQCFDEALRINPKLEDQSRNVALNLAQGYEEAGQRARAREIYKRLLARNKHDVEAKDAMKRLGAPVP